MAPRRASRPLGRARCANIGSAGLAHSGPTPASSRRHSTETCTPQAVTSGIAPLPHRRLIFLTGAGAAKFLQGLVTNNVDSARLSPFYAAFLNARGRVLWDVFVWVWPELVAEQGHWGCYIEVDADEVEALGKHLEKHKLRSKIAITHVPAEGSDGIRVWAAWGGAHAGVTEWGSIAGLEDPRALGMYRYLADAQRETIVAGMQPVDAKYYHAQRYLHGVAEGQVDIPRESALPFECNVDVNGGIDFKKGCYVGQELTIRTKHTGVVRKRILPVRLHSCDSAVSTAQALSDDVDASQFNPSFTPTPQPGAVIRALDEAGTIKIGRRTHGEIIAATGNVGLASCRFENMTSLQVSAEGGLYKPGMQFGVDVDGTIVKVEPVLYDRFVTRTRALWGARKKVVSVKEQDSMEPE